ncbi:AraC family transcriptional regulator [Brevibacillus laterosporus]|uniref:AraC family transcriptional regulator n=2 Tax=Brevibacillus laterosporus TaxID=1465 RepID=A0AAP8U4T1_BRELA|nr:AraC family transcriptional regulator [Brevibacillus laterosporus]PPB02076.1 AraC family transcriptional regulator [Brevibacillus laterosporus]
MKVNDHMLLWNHVFLQVIDIRFTAMEKGEKLREYRLPVSAFLYTVRGSARIWLDREVHIAERFHIFHGGKGTSLSILAEDELDYYLILYKPILSMACHQKVVQLMEEDNPFQYQYAFAPSYPLSLFEKMEQLNKEWHQSTALGKLQVKAIFYQFVYELLCELHQQKIDPIRPDLVAQAVRYIHEHFHEPLTLDSIAQALDCSAGHLSRLFKRKLQNSPIHYLGQVRVDRTTQMLMQTDATLQEIAERVGFPDAHSLSRSFKKYKGLSPTHFRNKLSHDWQDRELPLSMQGIAILKNDFCLYNDNENHLRYRTGRELLMQRRTKRAVMTLVMCISLLMSACSSQANTNVSSQAPINNPTGANSDQSKEGQQAKASAKTRMVSTLKGDVEIPAEPKRVASDQYMGHLLKLGIIPVGVRSFMLSESWINKAGISKDILAGIEDLGAFPMNLEKLTNLEPDLIIGSIEENIESYQKIGTTVFLPYWEGQSTAGPLEKFRRISEIFGKQQEAEQWITEYMKKVAEARKKIDGIVKEGETVSVVQVAGKSLYVLAAEGGNYGSSTIYQMLQLPPTKKALNMKEGFESISLEVLPEYMGDHIFIYGAGDEGADQIIHSDLWRKIPAVQKGQIYMYGSFGDKGDEFVMEDPYSLELQLDTIVDVLLAKKKEKW